MKSTRIVLVAALVAGSCNAAAQGGSGAAGDPSIGDFRYRSVPQTERCSTDRGTIAACANTAGTVGYDPTIGSDDPTADPRPGERSGRRETEHGAFCGNGICEANEDARSCSADCGGSNPSGVGPRLGEGNCFPQGYPASFAVENRPSATCGIDGVVGGEREQDVILFGELIEVTAADETDAAAVVVLTSGTCPRGKPKLSARIELVCANGLMLPREVECTCVKDTASQ